MSIKHSRLCAALLAATVSIASGLQFTNPAAAQIVYDPSNYAQNVLQAARALEQINNQITSLQNQAQMLINQARNLASLPQSSLNQIQQSIQRTQQLLGQAQRIAHDVGQIDHAFSTTYGAASTTGALQEHQCPKQIPRATISPRFSKNRFPPATPVKARSCAARSRRSKRTRPSSTSA